MKDQFMELLAEPRKVLEWSWNFIAFISLIIAIMAVVTAAELDDTLKGFGFGAIWTMFLIIFLVLLGQYVLGGSARGLVGDVKSKYATPLLTGFWLGTTFMLSVAFFILGCVYAAFDDDSVKTLGAFYIMQFFFLGFFSIYAMLKRSYVYSTSYEGESEVEVDKNSVSSNPEPSNPEWEQNAVVVEPN